MAQSGEYAGILLNRMGTVPEQCEYSVCTVQVPCRDCARTLQILCWDIAKTVLALFGDSLGTVREQHMDSGWPVLVQCGYGAGPVSGHYRGIAVTVPGQ